MDLMNAKRLLVSQRRDDVQAGCVSGWYEDGQHSQQQMNDNGDKNSGVGKIVGQGQASERHGTDE